MIPIIVQARKFGSRIAVISDNEKFTYDRLLEESAMVGTYLLGSEKDLKGARIGYMIKPGFEHVAIQWGIWRAGGVAIPLCLTYPIPSLEYVIEDSGISQIIVSEEFFPLLEPISIRRTLRLIKTEDIRPGSEELPDVTAARNAMILYTSGTTGSPKGVVTTHENITCQIESLIDAWQWSEDDHILNILPLHHVHGIINILCCALWSGAICEFLPKFDAEEVFKAFSKGSINLFMAVPTIYYKLIVAFEEFSEDHQEVTSQLLSNFRLMVSGSAALPVSVMDKWERISGHRLLERYGMTEIGMALSNPYAGERKPGHVGHPLPGVDVRLQDDTGDITNTGPGEIQVKGLTVFKEYWNRRSATKESFTGDGWFKTGDIAELGDGSYRILGRSSVDIIKSGGYKISALEIEEVSRKYEGVLDCAVIGLPDDEWGEIIAIGIVSNEFNWEEYQKWIKSQMPAYKIPRKHIMLDELPRNALGKVTKKPLAKMFIER